MVNRGIAFRPPMNYKVFFHQIMVNENHRQPSGKTVRDDALRKFKNNLTTEELNCGRGDTDRPTGSQITL